MKTIAIIPARGGSKRIPRKNIKKFLGKPIIAYSIEAARSTGVFDRVVVSTDDDEIADVAAHFGADVPFRRPDELSGDHVSTLPVVAHAIQWLTQNDAPVCSACCIYATAPLLLPEYLRAGLDLLNAHDDAEFAFSVTSYDYPILRALKRSHDGTIAMLWPEHEMTRSQDLSEAWHDAGQFYWGRTEAFLGKRGIFSARSYALELPRHMVQDIDSPEDWERAERLWSVRQTRFSGGS